MTTHAIAEQLDRATSAPKCHGCGCFQNAVATLEGSELAPSLRPALSSGRDAFHERTYDCLGCDVCWPANALNLAGELIELPANAGCPTELPEARTGWPRYPGDYIVGAFTAPVAVCTLHSHELVGELAARTPAGLAIVGSLQTENLGVERIIQNVVTNPNIRILIVCGRDTDGRVGHFPGQTLLALAASGVSDEGRIVGAQGKRPELKNLEPAWVAAFRDQIRLIDRRGVCDAVALAAVVEDQAAKSPGPAAPRDALRSAVRVVSAAPPQTLVLDPAGYVVIHADARRGRLVAEHYENRGTITTVIEGETANAVVATLLAEKLVTRLDHAAYLGRQLALAEIALQNGTVYRQDAAPEPAELEAACCGDGADAGTDCSGNRKGTT